jgi:hypothetical protein
MNQAAHSQTHSLWSYYSFPSPLLGRFPDLRNSSPRFLGVDQVLLPSRGMGPDLGLISRGWCLPSPDETARWVGPLLLGVQARSRLLREMELQGEGWPGIPSRGVPPPLVLCPSLLRCSPATIWWFKEPDSWDLAGASKNVEGIVWQTRNQETLGGVENSCGPGCIPCLSPEQRIHRIFKKQYRASNYKNVLRHT